MAKVLIPSGGVTVAVAESTILGMMAVSDDGRNGWVDHLYIHPSAVGQGIGTELTELAKRCIRSPIRLYCFQANSGARRFYERHGFRPIAFSEGNDNEEKCPDVLYECVLPT